MIVTLTAHPSLDRTITLDAPLRPGEVQSAIGAREDAGGKGINVSRVVAAAALQTLAVLPLAGGDPYAAALAATGIATRAVPVHGSARANVTITDPEGVTTKLNLPGAPLTSMDASAVVSAVAEAADGAAWLVLAGSLPPGAPDDFYVTVIEAVRARFGTRAPRMAVDTSGAALAAVVERGRPDLIKPNDDELAELAGEALPSGDLPAAVTSVARRLVPGRVSAALVTLGADGAVLIDAEGAWVAVPPRIRVASTVGAGDSSLAGYLLADVAGASPEDRLRSAVRYGAAAASLPGTQAPTPADLPSDDVPVTRLSPVSA
ncbi:1-phosphofructokinase family hexose kinase [Microbacterium insulae]|uniref:1-phosphofructokinase family hexose kinase n=1 Tax=Microbacterium insulae TaxID=483014 RepID=A0ABW3AMM6_9MICO